MFGTGDAPAIRPKVENGWLTLLMESIDFAVEQGALILRAAATKDQGPERLDRPFLLVEHPFGRFEKWLSETILVTYLTATTDGVPVDVCRKASALAQSLSSLVAHPAYRRVWLRLPYSCFTSVGAALALLDTLGLAEPKAMATLKVAFDLSEAHWTERASRHSLERAWFNARLTKPRPIGDSPAWPDALPHPIYLLRSDVYSLTHEVWFGTDFGRRQLRHSSNLHDVLRICAAWLPLVGDVDCYGEVVASLIMLGSSPGVGLETALQLALMGEIERVNASLTKTNEPRIRLVDYHPIYAGAVAALATYRRGEREIRFAPGRDAEASVELKRIAREQLEMYMPMGQLHRDKLLDLIPADMLLDGLLTAAARQAEPNWIYDLLRFARASHLQTSWTMVEARRLAERLTNGST